MATAGFAGGNTHTQGVNADAKKFGPADKVSGKSFAVGSAKTLTGEATPTPPQARLVTESGTVLCPATAEQAA